MSKSSSEKPETILAWPKLNGLERLRDITTAAFKVPQFTSFKVSEWTLDDRAIIEMSRSKLNCKLVIVRSCAALEDEISTEPPGFFESVLNVNLRNTRELRNAINEVCKSYLRRDGNTGSHKVLVQEQLLDPVQSGVCRVGASEFDYVEIDYDSSLSRTDAVTAGLMSRRLYLSSCVDQLPTPWRQLKLAIDTIRQDFSPPFFLEFAIDKLGVPAVFQVRSDRRPIQSPRAPPPNRSELLAAGRNIDANGPLSVMADWNPAELLGFEPSTLDISLYNCLLMSGAWVKGRASLGWRIPADIQLMVCVGNRPYIKLRSSLESLLPQDIPKTLIEKIVKGRLATLKRSPQHHDKVEFKIMWSAFAFDEDAVGSLLETEGLSNLEIERLFSSLRKITRETLSNASSMLSSDQKGIKNLRKYRQSMNEISTDADPERVGNLLRTSLDACRQFGAIPFARQARIAFTFRHIISYLIECDEELATEIHKWETGLNTVTRDVATDLSRLSVGEITKREFDKLYGHLRPNTYDLDSQRYDERLIPLTKFERKTHESAQKPSRNEILDRVLSTIQSNVSQAGFWDLAAGAFRAREFLKFEYSALLSDILLALGNLADRSKISRSDFKKLDIENILLQLEASENWSEFDKRILGALEDSTVEAAWRLPDLMFSSEDLHVISELEIKPTFIGAAPKTGHLKVVNGETALNSIAAGSVVAIEAPDPGYDWIFSQKLGAFISAYGGEFSHMGIRCAEFEVPAALGCGRSLFSSLADATSVTINPESQELWADEQKVYPA